YLSVGRDILRAGKTSSLPSTDPVVIADPNFDLTGTGRVESPSDTPTQSRGIRADYLYFPRLSGTRAEGEAIARMLNIIPILGDEALESKVKQLRAPRIVHLATHGF